MKQIEQFIQEAQLEMTAKQIPGRNDIPRDTWSKGARHFVCEIKRVGFGARDPMIVFFSQGSAHTKPPTLADVLDCLASDVSSIDGQPFEGWADDMGYKCAECGQYTRDAAKTYHMIEEQAHDLKALLDDAAYAELLWNVERL